MDLSLFFLLGTPKARVEAVNGEGNDWDGTIYAESFGLGKVSLPLVLGVGVLA